MKIDEKIKLAQDIEGQLVGITPSEWSKWCAYVQRSGLERALQLAQVMQSSPSLRPGPKQAYRTITQVIGKFRQQLKSISPADLAEILGYAGRWLVARRSTEYERWPRG